MAMAAPKRGPFLFQCFAIYEGGGQLEGLNPVTGTAELI